ncbi:MAG: Fe-S-containing hydro-lyase [Chloroflexi bacterium]|nr:Fe-S-containing hydro-lyase [Chloroflexota bacterium]
MKLTTPLTDEIVEKLHAGDKVEISGSIYVARDAAHKRMVETLDRGEKLPADLHGQIVYYMGPSPTKPGKVIGSAGPTTSGRMDKFAARLMAEGLKGMIGKGLRAAPVKDAMKQYKAVYFAATGGAAALLAQRIRQAEIIAYPELGAEALQRLQVEDFPVIVVNDVYGGDAYAEGKKQFQRA